MLIPIKVSMKRFLLSFALVTMFSGCTVTLLQTDTHGSATDVVDLEESTDATVDTDVAVPIKPI